jgi:hypothetical protein
MLRKTMVILAVALALGGSGLSTSAFARGGDSSRHRVGGDLGGAGFASGFAVGGADRGYGAYSGRDSAFGGEFHGYGRHDVWGHWGAYYGPMIAPF